MKHVENYKEVMRQRLIVQTDDLAKTGEVTKFDDESFSVLWTGETHSERYSPGQLFKNEEGAFFVKEA